MKPQALQAQTLAIRIEGMELTVSALYRPGPKEPIVFLHGFGSTKEDYADIVQHPAFDGHAVIAYDAPGCGASICPSLDKVGIPLLLHTARAVLAHYRAERFHLLGHSMGGLTALLLADELQETVLSFTNIEGNIAPEDCFLSRQIQEYPASDAEQFFADFIWRTSLAPDHASALYATSLRHKVRPAAVRGIFTSMVALSDHGELMEKFLALPCRKMFMYGASNAGLSYLGHIQANGVRLAEIPACGHFPMYSNPVAMWQAVAEFIRHGGCQGSE